MMTTKGKIIEWVKCVLIGSFIHLLLSPFLLFAIPFTDERWTDADTIKFSYIVLVCVILIVYFIRSPREK